MNTNTIEQAPEKVPVYTFRKLGAPDVFLMFKILSKIGIGEFAECFGKDSVKQLMNKLTGTDTSGNTTVVGISVMLEAANVILGNLPRCEAEIYQMLSNTSNLTVEEVKALEMIPFTKMVIDFVKKEEFRDFIQVVSELFKSEK